MRRIAFYNVFIQPIKGEEFQCGVTDESVLRVVDGFLLFYHTETRQKMGLNATQVVRWRLEPEYIDATKNA